MTLPTNDGRLPMTTYKLANIIVDDSERAAKAPLLYCRASGPFSPDGEGAIRLYGAGTYDFATYFNAFSNKKWRTYASVDNVWLHLEVRGAAATLQLTRADAFALEPIPIEGTVRQLPASDEWVAIDVAYPNCPDELLAFTLTTEGELHLRRSCYRTEVAEERIRPVELALATTTFKKEEFVIPNIALVKEAILGSEDPIGSHFTMHVVDNGRTLDVEELQSDRVRIHPNDNVGGSGGFARGMIEAMRQEPVATHVLLMDDDVSVSPESIKRTYTLLTLLNDEYAEAFVSGAMLDYDIPDNQWEDIGFIDDMGHFMPLKPPLRMSLLKDVVINEDYECRKPDAYAAWWYCCIPVETIRREGLPLPLFVRSDDTEYGCRCHPKIMTMNGICVWHVSFHIRYNAAVERYQTTRNTLIANAVTGMSSSEHLLRQLKEGVQIELKKFNYDNALLAVEGLEDFLKGPAFIMERGRAEAKFMEKNRQAEKLKGFEELEGEVGPLDLDRVTIYEDSPRSLGDRLVDFASFNGQRGPLAPKPHGGGMPTIPNEGWLYPAGTIRGAEQLLSIDAFNRKGVVRTRDRARFKEVWKRYKRALKDYKRRKDEVEQAYRAVRDEITSTDYWMSYLGIE